MEEEREVWSGWSQRQNECQGKIIAKKKERGLKTCTVQGVADDRHKFANKLSCACSSKKK